MARTWRTGCCRLPAEHWFGTDQLGRDIYTRVVHGAHLTLIIVVLVAILAAPVGLLVGTVAGYVGGLVDTRADAHHRHLPGLSAS